MSITCETNIEITVSGVYRNYFMTFTYEVRGTDTFPTILTTESRMQFSPFSFDANWFWEICPAQVRQRLDTEMMKAWHEGHHLVVEKVTA